MRIAPLSQVALMKLLAGKIEVLLIWRFCKGLDFRSYLLSERVRRNVDSPWKNTHHNTS